MKPKREQKFHGSHWLPLSVELKMTAFEAGALAMLLTDWRAGRFVFTKDVPEFRPDEAGGAIATTVGTELLERLSNAVGDLAVK